MDKGTLTLTRDAGYGCFLLIGVLSLSQALVNDLTPETLADPDLWFSYIAPAYVLAAGAALVGVFLTVAARRDPVLLGLCCANLVPPMLTVLEGSVAGSVARALWVFQVLSDVAFPLRWFLVSRAQ